MPWPLYIVGALIWANFIYWIFFAKRTPPEKEKPDPDEDIYGGYP